jgi:ketosteroid isomerase-like protein
MSRENVEAASQVLEAITKRDLTRVIDLTDPEIEWHSFFAQLLPKGEYHGHAGIREYMGDLAEIWDYLHVDVQDLLDAGGVVIGIGRVRYRGKESGVESEAAAGWTFKFRDGKLLRFRAFREPEQTLESVGL